MLYEALRKNHEEVHGEEEVPLPVTEVSTPTVEVVRIPAWSDGPMLWQGGTFYRSDNSFSVYLDDGRRLTDSKDEVIDFWNQNAAEWCEEAEEPEGAI